MRQTRFSTVPSSPGAAEFTGNGNGKVGLHDMQETAGSACLESSHLRGGRSLYAKGQHPGHRGGSWGAAATATAGGSSSWHWEVRDGRSSHILTEGSLLGDFPSKHLSFFN